MKTLILLIISLFFSCSALAELKGKKVIFVHGFQISAIKPSTSEEALRTDAIEQAGPVLNTIIDEYLFYDSAKRLTDNSLQLANQIKDFEAREVCRDGCFLVTGSTGDLVARFVISRLNQWEIDSQKFNILLSFDIVGAGGGTEIANTIIGIAQGSSLVRFVFSAVAKIFHGEEIKNGQFMGILNDLRPPIARNHASGNYDVPRLRIAAGKGKPIISRFIIKGRDDGLVPLHSACGSARQESIESCSGSIHIGGKVGSAKGPSALLYNHFPIMMAENMSHTEIDYKGKLVAVNNNTVFAHSTTGNTEFSVQEKTYKKGFWRFKKTYRTIDKPSDQLAVEFLIEQLQ